MQLPPGFLAGRSRPRRGLGLSTTAPRHSPADVWSPVGTDAGRRVAAFVAQRAGSGAPARTDGVPEKCRAPAGRDAIHSQCVAARAGPPGAGSWARGIGRSLGPQLAPDSVSGRDVLAGRGYCESTFCEITSG